MADFDDPESSLANYFDDLLSDEGTADRGVDNALPTVAMLQQKNTNMAASNLHVLPTKLSASTHNVELSRQLKSSVVRSSAPARLNVHRPTDTSRFAEVNTSHEQKLKLEKLFQSARTQLLDASVPELIKPVEVLLKPAPAFLECPDEIQDWDIAVTEIPSDDNIKKSLELSVEPEQLEGSKNQFAQVQWLENGRPRWAQNRFDVLLFQVSGLTLAVPLISLGQIRPIGDGLTPLFGQADWFMGVQITDNGKISTVNTAKFVMPERYDANFIHTAKYVVSIDGVPWGLAVDSVNQPISLLPEEVKWRTDRSKRPWLAGTVKDHMCALLDIPKIGELLMSADKNYMAPL